MTDLSRRQRFAERMLLSGASPSGLVIDRPTGRFAVTFRRSGLQPASGCMLLFPFWLLSRLRWSRGSKTWSVMVTTAGPREWQLNRFVYEDVAPTQEEGRRAAEEVLRRLRRGDFDHLAAG
jgi:hypothetical protein